MSKVEEKATMTDSVVLKKNDEEQKIDMDCFTEDMMNDQAENNIDDFANELENMGNGSEDDDDDDGEGNV